MYHRRVREANCIVGKRPKVEAKFVKNCACSDSDFEWYVCHHVTRLLIELLTTRSTVSSTTTGPATVAVYLSRVRSRVLMTTHVTMTRITGMRVPHTARSHIPAARAGSVLTTGRHTYALGSGHMAHSSGS